MSRSNPTENAPNPATRWFEWNGDGDTGGHVRYYDKVKKETVELGQKFGFIFLDQLASVGGWHELSKSAIYSNQVRDTRQDTLIVKAFKEGTIAEGLYQSIKDRVTSKAVGGYFVSNIYIAYSREDKTLALGCLQLKGAALNAWVEFQRANRAEIEKKAISISGFTEGKTGKVKFRVPVFGLKDLSDAFNQRALELDKDLQAFLASYLKRNKKEQVEHAAAVVPDTYDVPDEDLPDNTPLPPIDDDSDIPF